MDELDLNPRILTALCKAGLKTYEDVLNLSTADIARSTKLTQSDSVTLRLAVSEKVYRQPKLTALDIKNGNCPSMFSRKSLSLGCPILDEIFRGGILSQGITEVTGESAAGKTQLCLQLCLMAQLPLEEGGLNGGAVYVCTEDVFPSKRLQQLIKSFPAQHKLERTKQLALGENIYVEHVAEKEQLEHCINHRIPILLERGLVKLLVVDSVAALFRSEFELSEAFQRAKSLQKFGAQLHELASRYNIPVVCVNQVTANMRALLPSDDPFVPALGLTWSNQVQTRLMLKRLPYKLPPSSDSNPSCEIPVRSMEVIFSPYLPKDTIYFVVEGDGIRGLR
ncbi:DNA repair protein XRCC3-like isoform X1 [Apostichopus japonicus]|uniref:DNA repair protein XRCC3-like isoform X1 n=1 Tax=Stichopus japonicus TaxID=307972 RepID=UPI003AB83E8D